MFMLPLFALLRRIAEPTPFFSTSFPPPEISLFWGTLIAITLTGTQKVLLTPVARKYSTGLFPLTSFPLITLIYQLFSIAPLAVAPDISFASSSLVLSCS